MAKTTKKKTTTKKKATASKSKSKAGRSAKSTAKKTTKKKASTRKKAVGEAVVKVDRRNPKRDDRRDEALEDILNQELESAEPVERREKVNRRRQIDPTTCERDYNNDEIEFMHALDDYKRRAGRMFPTCSEILEVVRAIGYHRLTPEEMATLGIGQSSAGAEPNAENPEGENGAADGDSKPNSGEFSEAIGEVAAAGDLSDSIRSESETASESFDSQSQPVVSESFAPEPFAFEAS